MAGRVELLSDSPVAHDKAALHNRVVNAMAALMQGDGEAGKSIALTGGWGSGKSSVIETLRARFQKAKEAPLLFVFDAWAHQDDPLRRAFLEEFLRFAEAHVPVDSRLEIWRREICTITGRRETVTTTSQKHYTRMAKVTYFLTVGCAPVGAMISLMVKPEYKPYGVMLALLPVAVAGLWKLVRAPRREPYMTLMAERGAGPGEKEKSDSLFNVIVRDAEETKTTETEKAGEPMAAQFFQLFAKMASVLVGAGQSKRKLAIVIDNLDRLEPAKAVAMWSTMRVFFELGQTAEEKALAKQLWLIAPFDRTALERLWAKESAKEDLKKLVDSFVSKTFQIEFRVASPVLSKWREFFVDQFRRAFQGEEEQKAADDVFRIYERLQEKLQEKKTAPSLRDIKLFVNRMVGLHLQWPDIDLRYVAFYLMNAEKLAVNPLLMAKEETFDASIRELLPDGWNAEIRQRRLGSMHFNVEEEEAVHALIGERLEQAVLTQDEKTIQELSGVKQFALACERAVNNTADALAADGWKLMRTFEILDPLIGAGTNARKRLCAVVKRSSHWPRFDEWSEKWVRQALAMLDPGDAQELQTRVLKDAAQLPTQPAAAELNALSAVVGVFQAQSSFRFEPTNPDTYVAVHGLCCDGADKHVLLWLRCDDPPSVMSKAIDAFQRTDHMAKGTALLESLRERPLNWVNQAKTRFGKGTSTFDMGLLVLTKGNRELQDKILDSLFERGLGDVNTLLGNSAHFAAIGPLVAALARRRPETDWNLPELPAAAENPAFAEALAAFLKAAGLGDVLVSGLQFKERHVLLNALRRFGQPADCLDMERFVSEIEKTSEVSLAGWRDVLMWMNGEGALERTLVKRGVYSEALWPLFQAVLSEPCSDEILTVAAQGLAQRALEIPEHSLPQLLLKRKGAGWLPAAAVPLWLSRFPDNRDLQQRVADDGLLAGLTSDSFDWADDRLEVLPDTEAIPLLEALERRVDGELLLNPQDGGALARKGDVLWWKSQRMPGAQAESVIHDAEKLYRRASEADSALVTAMLGRARTLRWRWTRTGDRDTARKLIEECEAITAQLADPRAALLRAQVLGDRAGRFLHGSEAMDALDRALEQSEAARKTRAAWPAARVVKADLLRQKASWTARRADREELMRHAERELSLALQEAPGHFGARVSMARVLLDLDEAAEFAEPSMARGVSA
ncbi:MAG: AAA family ATPase [Bryobacterales bacterium]|nr:AAA family ATPase [Bryobacterales bacterium]